MSKREWGTIVNHHDTAPPILPGRCIQDSKVEQDAEVKVNQLAVDAIHCHLYIVPPFVSVIPRGERRGESGRRIGSTRSSARRDTMRARTVRGQRGPPPSRRRYADRIGPVRDLTDATGLFARHELDSPWGTVQSPSSTKTRTSRACLSSERQARVRWRQGTELDAPIQRWSLPRSGQQGRTDFSA